MAVAGLAISLTFGIVTHRIQEENEDRLLRQRASEGASSLEATVPNSIIPLRLLATTRIIGQEGNGEGLARLIGTQLEDNGGRFASVSIWALNGTEPVFVAGEEPALADEPEAVIRDALDRATRTDTVAVVDLLDEDPPRIGYVAHSHPEGEGSAAYVVYGERELAGDRTDVDRNERAFDGMDYAIYLGTDEVRSALTSASTADLPLDGEREVQTIELGDRTLLLVVQPREPLGGTLQSQVPLWGTIAGIVITLGAAILTDRLQKRRVSAELLALENARLYANQRESSHLLQRNLLPATLPEVPGLEVEVRYQAGTADTEVGGDWYDVVEVDGKVVVVVGDVSGRGLGAASVMASVRFTMRTLALQGLAPADVVRRANQIVNAEHPTGHFATAVCARIDVASRTVEVARAGHPRPLVVHDGTADLLDGPVGAPIGVRTVDAYPASTSTLPSAATMLFMTDGLFERRGETVDEGVERLRLAASRRRGTLADDVGSILEELTGGSTTDDTVILALRWTT